MSVEYDTKTFQRTLKRQSIENLKRLKSDYEKLLNVSINKSYYKICYKNICKELDNRNNNK